MLHFVNSSRKDAPDAWSVTVTVTNPSLSSTSMRVMDTRLRACSWGALFWLAVGACCGVPWVGYCVLFAYHFARFSAQPRAPAADRPKSLSVASTLEAIFT